MAAMSSSVFTSRRRTFHENMNRASHIGKLCQRMYDGDNERDQRIGPYMSNHKISMARSR